jgi:hypothetical protein
MAMNKKEYHQTQALAEVASARASVARAVELFEKIEDPRLDGTVSLHDDLQDFETTLRADMNAVVERTEREHR